jgi:hypothetical protein
MVLSTEKNAVLQRNTAKMMKKGTALNQESWLPVRIGS